MPEQSPAALLTWEQGSYAASYGKAGGVTLFTSNYSTSREDIAAGTPYVLSSVLPGHTSKRWKVETPEAAQAKAERVLRAWDDLIFGSARRREVGTDGN